MFATNPFTLFPASADTPFSLLVETAEVGATNNLCTTDPIDTTGAKLIVVALGHYTFGTAPALTDSEGNTWTLMANYGGAGNSHIKLYYCIDPVTDAAHTFETAVAAQYASMAVQAFAGPSAVTAEDEDGISENGTSNNTITATSTAPNSLFVTALCSGNSQHDSASVDDGFSTPIQAVAAGDLYNVAMAYKVRGTAGSETPTWTVANSTALSACVANVLPE